MPVNPAPGPQRPGIFRKALMWWGTRPLLQVFIIGFLVVSLYFLAVNVIESMRRIGVTPGFDFLNRAANFEIGESSISFQAGDTYIRAIIVGLLNTLKVSVLGCVLATVLGVAVGVAGLSRNLLLATAVRWYVEIIRNTPLLLQLFFWISLTSAFPAPRQASAFLGSIYFTNRGVFIPGGSIDGLSVSGSTVFAAAIATFAAILFILKRSRALNITSTALSFTAVVVVVAAGLSFSGAQLNVDIPELTGFNIRGGSSLSPEFAALLTGLVVKFSAAIAEIVRAGIQSVNNGQWEAARSLGLHPGQIMRLVVLPQALRVITPLTTSSYLDLTKDSSLAVAIGYPELVSVINTTANTTGQSLEALMILIGTYLVINLSVSVLMNEYNRRVALRGNGR
jgi:general L-amino acid transport system permease protein